MLPRESPKTHDNIVCGRTTTFGTNDPVVFHKGDNTQEARQNKVYT